MPEASIKVPRSRGWVNFDSSVGQLEALLKTRYHVYHHVEARGEHVGADEYHLPEDVAPHVDFVMPGVVFAPRRGGGVAARAATTPQAKIYPVEPAMLPGSWPTRVGSPPPSVPLAAPHPGPGSRSGPAACGAGSRSGDIRAGPGAPAPSASWEEAQVG